MVVVVVVVVVAVAVAVVVVFQRIIHCDLYFIIRVIIDNVMHVV